jgi:phytoene dehydrogenase-like protein
MNRSLPVIVVGGGLAGLATASLLRARDIPVRVVEASETIGGRFRVAPAWFPRRKESQVEAFAAESKATVGEARKLSLKVLADRVGTLHTGSMAFVMKSDVGSFSSRLQFRTLLPKIAMSEDRLAEFSAKEGLEGMGEFALALAGSAAAEMRTTPQAAYSLARELILDRLELFALAGGVERLISELAQHGGDIRTGVKAQSLVVQDCVVRGVHVESKDGTELMEASNVVLALPVPAARALFDEATWPVVAAEERIRYDATNSRPGLYLQFALRSPVKEDFFAFVANPAGIVIAAADRVWGHSAFPVDHDVTPDEIADRKAALRAAASKLVKGFESQVSAESSHFDPCDDCHTVLAGGRERPHHAVPGIDHLYLAGHGANAPGQGLERVLCSARIVARQIAASLG